MKLTYQAKIEVLLDKINLLYSNIKDDDGLPKLEIQLLKKYSRELNEVIEKLESEAGNIKPEALPPVTKTEEKEAIPVAPTEEIKSEPTISKKVEEERSEPAKEDPEKKQKEKEKTERSSLTFIDEPDIPLESKGTEQVNGSGPAPETKEEREKKEEAISKKVSTEKPETDLKMDRSESDRAEIYQTLEKLKARKDEVKKRNNLIAEEEEGEEEDNSINKRFKGQDALVDKLKGKAISDLRTEIDLNNKFWFINNLFEGDSEDYKRAVSQINEFSRLPEAKDFIDSQLKPKYNWEEHDKAAEKFMEFVNRKFI